MSSQYNEKMDLLPLQPVLDPVVQAFLQQSARNGEPSPHDLDPYAARQAFDRLQSGTVSLFATDIEDLVLKVGPTGETSVRIVRPVGGNETYPIIIYLHGGAWVAGNVFVYDRLIREIATGANAAVVFVDYTLVPEAAYPTQIEQAYAALEEIVRNASALGLDATRLAVVGDCSGGNMAAALTLLAKKRRGPEIALQILLYPIIANPETVPLTKLPRDKLWLTSEALRSRLVYAFPDALCWRDIAAFPFNATVAQLNDLPAALVVVAEHDVVRDGAEEYARHLTEAGVVVTCTRYNGVTHDFMLLNALRESPATRSAWIQVMEALRAAL